MIKDGIRILENENEVKPNKTVGLTGIFIVALALIIFVLNELGVFHVDLIYMRLAIGIVVFLSSIQFILAFSKTNKNPVTKYIIIALTVLEIAACLTMLNVHINMIVLYPLVVATSYHSKKVCWFTLVLTIITALLTPVLAYLFKTIDTRYLAWLYSVNRGIETVSEVGERTVTKAQSMLQMILYVGLPRSLVIIAFGVLMFKISNNGRESIKNQLQITYLYETDILTDIRNRNCFEKKIVEYPQLYKENLYCIYIDANGLRDLNNKYSHAEGDRMLKCLAHAMATNFEVDDSFRTGGDEFVAFAYDVTPEDVAKRIENIEKELSENNYSAAIGYSFIGKNGDVDELVRQAERNMYQSKKEYYQNKCNDRRKAN